MVLSMVMTSRFQYLLCSFGHHPTKMEPLSREHLSFDSVLLGRRCIAFSQMTINSFPGMGVSVDINSAEALSLLTKLMVAWV